jgi:hypothetical protein
MPIVGARQQGLPPSQQYTEHTSEVARRSGERLGWSPQQIDFAIAENLGGAGRTALGAADTLMGKPSDSVPVLGGLTSGVLRTYGGQLSANEYNTLDRLTGQLQEPIAAAIRSLPEYQQATPDRQTQMVQVAQQELQAALKDQIGMQSPQRDLGLPPKYLGVKDPKREQQINDALATYRAWDTDPKNAPKPTKDELKLALTYDDPDLINPKWTLANQQLQERNRAIRGAVQQRVTAGAVGG